MMGRGLDPRAGQDGCADVPREAGQAAWQDGRARHRRAPVPWGGFDRVRVQASRGHGAMGDQSRQRPAPAVPATRAGHAARPAPARPADVRRRPRVSARPPLRRAEPLQPGRSQAGPHRCPHQRAVALRQRRSGELAQTEARSHSSEQGLAKPGPTGAVRELPMMRQAVAPLHKADERGPARSTRNASGTAQAKRAILSIE